MKQVFAYLSLIFLGWSAVVLIGLQMKVTGFLLLIGGGILLILSPKQFAKELNIVYATAAILALAPLNTNLTFYHAMSLGTLLAMTSILTYTLANIEFKKKNPLVLLFSLVRQTKELKTVQVMIGVTLLLSYIVVPFYFKVTGVSHNWSFDMSPLSLLSLFSGLLLVGLWEEIFFKSNILTILDNHFSFIVANIMQAIFAASFLYAIGFRNVGFLLTFAFAFTQGVIYSKSTIWHVVFLHICMDIIVFLTLLQIHYPHSFPHLMMTG